MGDRWAYLRAGLRWVPDVVALSRVYETAPVGGPEGQGPFLNMVAELRTEASPHDLLACARRAEAAAGRVRDTHWGPRTLDVDILLVGDVLLEGAELQIPHPRMWERGFVLVPLADLAPDLVAGRLTDALRAGVVPAGTINLKARP